MRRRQFLKSVGTAAAITIIPRHVMGGEGQIPPSEKLNVACIGVGGRGADNVQGLAGQNLVAFADVDDQRAAATYKKYPAVKTYRDYRRMFDELGAKIEAVAISTPDHMHFHPALMAMNRGLHVYLEKPLAHNVWQIRTLTELARKKKLATQLGTQRHAFGGMHRVVELVHSGAIGEVREVHAWTGGKRGMPKMPDDTPPVPRHLDWDLWLGPAPARPYHPSICPYGWRFWWDYGTGETGNMGCHILDVCFWALDLKYPTKVEASGPPVDALRSSTAMAVKFEFPARGQRPPVALHWYHAENGPDVLRKHNLSEKGNHTLLIGSQGMLLCGYGKPELLPKEKFADFKAPQPTIPESPGFYNEFVAAGKGGKPATCAFDYSGPLAETVILGNVAYRAGGFEWDAASLVPKGNAAAERLIREPLREGWKVDV